MVKKKGRPTFLDIQKRTLKQQQQRQNPSPSPSPRLLAAAHREQNLNGRKIGDQDGPPDSGPTTTPLPDKKLLLFILDRLQKKDTYGVFSEPVGPDELPDYHDIIKHPMDFGTVRKKLSSGVYSNLELFEKDVFLISSNAMCYNSPETVYFRQARSIHALAKKDFENLRQESDDEPKSKSVRKRSRPTSKNTIKSHAGRSPGECAASDYSDATPANVGDDDCSGLSYDFSRKRPASGKPGTTGTSTGVSLGLCNNEISCWIEEQEKGEEHPGSSLKGVPTRYGRKPIVMDVNLHNSCRQPGPVMSIFDAERKQLIPVGLLTEHAYARSLARFAANLGPDLWALAAEKIKRALPPGMKFGRGWVGDTEATQQFRPSILSTSPHSTFIPKISCCNTVSRGAKLPRRTELPSQDLAVEEVPFSRKAATSASSDKFYDSVEGADPSRGPDSEFGANLSSRGSDLSNQSRAPFLLQSYMDFEISANGLSTSFGFNLASQHANMVSPATLYGSLGLETPMTHIQALDLVSRGNNSFVHQRHAVQLDVEKVQLASNSTTVSSCVSATDLGCDPLGTSQGSSLRLKSDSIPPHVNTQFQSPVSASGLMVNTTLI